MNLVFLRKLRVLKHAQNHTRFSENMSWETFDIFLREPSLDQADSELWGQTVN